MKYIKTYEGIIVANTEHYNLPTIKNYIIWYDKASRIKNLEILKVSKNVVLDDRDNEPIILVDHLYNYHLNPKDDIKFERTDPSRDGITTGLLYTNIEESFKKYCLYQSDDLQDCIDVIPLIASTLKYNI